MNDRIFRIIGIPTVSVLMHVAYNGLIFENSRAWWGGFVMGLAMTVTIWEGNRAIFLLMRRFYPGYHQTGRRLLVQTLSSTVFTYAASLLLKLFFWQVLGLLLCPQNEFWLHASFNLLPTFVVTSFYESAHFFGEWKKNLQRSEALARASIQGELEALQRQLDPHFLFNSLNTLSALIDDTNGEAQRFVEQLADVYRYVLLSRDRPTVALAEELKFVEAYVALNKTRFRGDLQVEHALSATAVGGASVAPLSVQMLIENALKHNEVSAENPLHVRLSTADGYVSVANNVQLKTGLVKSTKIGLQNIIDRYRLLTERPVEVLNEGGFFTVRLPLI